MRGRIFNVIQYFKEVPLFFLLMFFLLMFSSLRAYDHTDDRENGIRSGMNLRIDYGTGCQYLKAGFFGGLTPRIDGEGNHFGCFSK